MFLTPSKLVKSPSAFRSSGLCAIYRKGYVVHLVPRPNVLHLKKRDIGCVAGLGKVFLHFRPNHPIDDVGYVQPRLLGSANHPAISQDSYRVNESNYLIESMRDIKNGSTLPLQKPEEIMKTVHLL